MVKFKLTFDKDEEVNWLNEMSNNGYSFKRFCLGFYTFEKCERGKYLYEVDMLNSFNEYSKFKEFMSEHDIEVMQRWYRWVYVRKLNDDTGFQLYSDTESKIAHYKRILGLFRVAFIIELVCLFVEIGIPLITKEMKMLNFVAISLIVFFAICIFGAYSKTKERIRNYEISLENT